MTATANDRREPTVEEMREVVSQELCQDKTIAIGGGCCANVEGSDYSCIQCWSEYGSDSEIRTRYQEMKGERG